MGLIKTDRVPFDLVNVAFVSKKAAASDMIDIISASGERIRERRRIAYSDAAGCLIDAETGGYIYRDPYPYITDRFYDRDLDNQVDFDELVPEHAMPYYYRSVRTYYGPADVPAYSEFAFNETTDQYDPLEVGNFTRRSGPRDKISLYYADGREYEGAYDVLIERVSADAVVTLGTTDYDLDTHGGYCAYRVHVFIDRIDNELIVGFPAGDIIADGADWSPSNIDPYHSEEVEALALFEYKDLETVINPTSKGKEICASIPTDSGYKYFTPDKAVMDQREFDFFFWRVVGEFKRTTELSAIIDDTINVGVIGPVSNELAAFLDDDPMYNYKFTCANPYPTTGTWVADVAHITEYDLVMVTGNSIDLPTLEPILRRAEAANTTIWINVGTRTNFEMIPYGTAATFAEDFFPKFTISSTAGTYNNLTVNDPASKDITSLTTGFILEDDKDDLEVINDGTLFYGQKIYRSAYILGDAATTVFTVKMPGVTDTDVKAFYSTADFDFENDASSLLYTGVVPNVSISGDDVTFTFNSAPAAKVYRLDMDLDPDSELVALYATDTSGDENAVMANINGRWVSTLGFSSSDSIGVHELMSNVIAAASRGEDAVSSGSHLTSFEVTSPWALSWTAGITKTGETVLSQEELDRYNFVVDVDTSGDGAVQLPRRIISQSTAQAIVAASDYGNVILPSDSVTYRLELQSYDAQHVDWEEDIRANQRPVVWTDRVSKKMIFPSGWKIDEFEDTDSRQIGRLPAPSVEGSAQVCLMVMDDDPVETDAHLDVTAEFEIVEQTVRDKYIDADDSFVKRVAVGSDIDWFCTQNTNPLSKANLGNWEPITGIKWYPWDGNSFLVDYEKRSTGGNVKYVQQLLNDIHKKNGDSYTTNKKNPYLPLKLNSKFDSRMNNAVTWYQREWNIRVDGDVDAGTLAHLMRNAIRLGITTYGSKRKYNLYGNVDNLIDSDRETMHGRRTWINTSTPKIDDSIIVWLNGARKIKSLRVEPYLYLPSGSPTSASYLHVWRYGGTRNGSYNFPFWNRSRTKNVKNGHSYNFEFSDIQLDTLYLNFWQDNAYSGRTKMWAFRSVQWLTEVSTTRIVNTNRDYSYDTVTMEFQTGQIQNIVWNPIPIDMRQWFTGYSQTTTEMETALEASLPADLEGAFSFDVTVDSSGTIRIKMTKSSQTFTTAELFGDEWDFTINQGEDIVIADADQDYWPDLLGSGLLEDESWDAEFVIRQTDGDMAITPIFYDTQTGDKLDTIDYNELMLRGIERVRLAALPGTIELIDMSPAAPTRFPKRFAMKPFCIVSRSTEGVLPVLGVDGDSPAETWGLKVKTGTITKDIVIPDWDYDDTVTIDGTAQLIDQLVGLTVKCTYRVTGEAYNTTLGAPYVDIDDEATSITDIDTCYVDRTPIVPSSVALTTAGDTLTIVDVDSVTGLIRFSSANSTEYDSGDTITADYTYREEWVSYRGIASDVFDICPSDGHNIDVDGTQYTVQEIVGKEIFVYMLPTMVTIEDVIYTSARTIYHSFVNPVGVNPLAILLAKVVVKGDTDFKDVQIIDTRIGGGGVADQLVGEASVVSDELEGFWDIGHEDGKQYLKGGTVVLRIPNTWRSLWEALGEDIDIMVDDFAKKWLPAGKTYVISWQDTVFDPTSTSQLFQADIIQDEISQE